MLLVVNLVPFWVHFLCALLYSHYLKRIAQIIAAKSALAAAITAKYME